MSNTYSSNDTPSSDFKSGGVASYQVGGPAPKAPTSPADMPLLAETRHPLVNARQTSGPEHSAQLGHNPYAPIVDRSGQPTDDPSRAYLVRVTDSQGNISDTSYAAAKALGWVSEQGGRAVFRDDLVHSTKLGSMPESVANHLANSWEEQAQQEAQAQQHIHNAAAGAPPEVKQAIAKSLGNVPGHVAEEFTTRIGLAIAAGSPEGLGLSLEEFSAQAGVTTQEGARAVQVLQALAAQPIQQALNAAGVLDSSSFMAAARENAPEALKDAVLSAVTARDPRPLARLAQQYAQAENDYVSRTMAANNISVVDGPNGTKVARGPDGRFAPLGQVIHAILRDRK